MCVCPQGGAWSQGGGAWPRGGAGSWGVPGPRGCLVLGECLVPGGGVWVPGQGVGSGPWAGAWWRPPQTAPAAGGTHPTGMHSCLQIFFYAVVDAMWTPSLVAMGPIFSFAVAITIGYRTHSTTTSKWWKFCRCCQSVNDNVTIKV